MPNRVSDLVPLTLRGPTRVQVPCPADFKKGGSGGGGGGGVAANFAEGDANRKKILTSWPKLGV